MGAFGKVYSGPQFTHLEGGTVGLTGFRGPFQMWGSPFTSFPAPFQDHFLHNSQRYVHGYVYLSIYIYVFIFKHTLNYISCFPPNPCVSQTFNRMKVLALAYKPAAPPPLPLLGTAPSPPALLCHHGLLVPPRGQAFSSLHVVVCASLSVWNTHSSALLQTSSSSFRCQFGVCFPEGLSFPGTPTPTTRASQQALGSFLALTVT